MVAGGIPAVQVFLDDGSGTFPYDITSKSRVAADVTRGRQDELAQVTPGQLALTLDNNDGRFTLGSTVIATPSPITVDQQVRVKVTPGGNLLTADQASFETSTAGFAFSALLGARDLGTSIAQSALHPTNGTKSLLLTWSTTVKGNTALITVPTVAGMTYTLSMDVFVPTGSPDVRATAAFNANGPTVSTKNATVRTSVTWTAAGTSNTVGIECLSATNGQQCFIDSLALNLGPAAAPFAPGGLTVTRFTGYVQQWPVSWPSGSDVSSVVQVTATDAQARAERRTLRSVIEEEVLPDSPAAYYTLGEPSTATTAADSSGNQAPALIQAGSGAPVVFGTATGPGTDGLTAATFAAGQYLTVPSVSVGGLLCAFATTTVAAATLLMVGNSGLTFLIDASGHLTDGSWVSPTVVTDGLVHVIEQRFGGGFGDVTYFDGVQVRSAVSGLVIVGGTLVVGQNFNGSIAHVTLWNTGGRDPARMAAHGTAMLTGFAGESGTARLTRTAGYASLPVGTFDTSLTNVAFTDITGKSAAETLRLTADAEFGLVFFDGSGSLTFHNRNRAVSKLSPDVTLTADMLDPGTAFIVDMQGILNYYTVTAAGTNVAQLVRSTSSEATHNRYPGSVTYLVQTDAEALDRGNWTVFTHAEPSPRVGSLVIDAMVLDAATQAALVACEPNTWVRVTGLPSQTPGGTTADFIVQGFADKVAVDSWSIAFNAANKAVAAPAAFILDDATYGVLDTNRLYV